MTDTNTVVSTVKTDASAAVTSLEDLIDRERNPFRKLILGHPFSSVGAAFGLGVVGSIAGAFWLGV